MTEKSLKPDRYVDIPEFTVALVEHFVEPIVGEAAIKVAREPIEQKKRRENFSKALLKANERFIKECPDESLAKALLELPVVDMPSIQNDLWDFCITPTSQALSKNLRYNLRKLNPKAADTNIDNAVESYMKILLQEIVSIDDKEARDKVDSLAGLKMEAGITQLSDDVEQIVSMLSQATQASIQDVLIKSSRMLDDLIPPPISLPANIDFRENCENRKVYTPPFAHRRVVDNALEFGSRVSFEQSWACLGNIRIPYFDLEFEAAFRNTADDGWIGVGFRSQSYYANFEHLLYLKLDGAVLLTQPNEIPPNFYADEMLRPPTEIDRTGFHSFHVQFTSDKLVLSVDDFIISKEVAKLPKVFGPGRIMFQAWPSWMAIKRIRISIQNGPKRPRR